MKKRPPEKLAVALRATNPQEAEIVRTILEDEGLFVLIPDKNTPLPIDLSPLDGEYSLLGSDVLVRAGDVKRAKQIIEDAREAGELEDDEEDDDDEDEDEEVEEEDDEAANEDAFRDDD